MLPKPTVRVLLTMAAAATALALSAEAQHHPKRVARGQIENMEKQWRAAELNDDVSAMDKLLSDDYLGITGNGQVVTKLQQLDRMRERQVQISRLDLSDVKVKLIGQIAIVTSMAEIEGSTDEGQLHGNFRSTRVYQRLPTGVWKLTSFEATRVRTPSADGHGGPKK